MPAVAAGIDNIRVVHEHAIFPVAVEWLRAEMKAGQIRGTWPRQRLCPGRWWALFGFTVSSSCVAGLVRASPSGIVRCVYYCLHLNLLRSSFKNGANFLVTAKGHRHNYVLLRALRCGHRQNWSERKRKPVSGSDRIRMAHHMIWGWYIALLRRFMAPPRTPLISTPLRIL